MTNKQNVDFVLRTVEERNIRFIRLWFTDISGNLKSFAISSEDLEEAFEEGVGFDGSAVGGFASREESDLLAFPDAGTFQVLPWRMHAEGSARVFCDIKTPSREIFVGDSRAVLTRVFREAKDLGYLLNVGPVIEYFLFDDDQQPRPLDNAGYFDLTSADSVLNLRRDTVLMLEQMSIPVEYSYHALGPSQHGMSFRFTEAVSCADNLVTARLIIKQMAFKHARYASFMPKPLIDAVGSALFLHQSLLDHEGNNVFWDEAASDDIQLSSIARSYLAGLITYAREYALVCNPTVNSYKRLVSGGEVPCFATWGRKNRSALVRIPSYKPGKSLACRLELRSPDPSCNPYLAFAVTLVAGLKGIQEGLALDDECTVDSNASLMASGRVPLPRNLGEAIDAFEKSDLMRQALGDHIYGFLLDQKRAEWNSFAQTVTDWEREHYYAGY